MRFPDDATWLLVGALSPTLGFLATAQPIVAAQDPAALIGDLMVIAVLKAACRLAWLGEQFGRLC
jgi:hypothetical protein